MTLGSADPDRARVPAAPDQEVQSRVRAQSPVLSLTIKVRRMGAGSFIRENVRRAVKSSHKPDHVPRGGGSHENCLHRRLL